MTEIGGFIVDTKMTIKALKEFLCDKIKNTMNIELEGDYVIIREHLLDRPTRVYHI